MSSKGAVKKVLAATVSASMALAMFGCSSGAATQTSSSTSSSASSSEATQSATRTVTAADGTQVQIPYEVTKVAPTIGALAEITMIVSNGEPVISAASTQQISDAFKAYFPKYEEGNPNGYSASSVEDIIASGTQVVYGVSTMFSDDQLQQLDEAGVAFVPINSLSTVDDLCNAAELIGDILGGEAPAQAKKFSTYWKGQLEEAKQATASVTAKQTIMECMYNSGAFTTINSTDIMNEYFEAAGLVNVTADMQQQSQGQGGGQGGSQGGGRGGAQGISLDEEAIAQANPQWIITNSTDGKDALMNDEALQSVDAIANDHVLVSPQGAYLWIVRSGEGAMVPMWLVSQIYPDLAGDYDATAAVKEFFQDYYADAITDEQAAQILAGASSAISR